MLAEVPELTFSDHVVEADILQLVLLSRIPLAQGDAVVWAVGLRGIKSIHRCIHSR